MIRRRRASSKVSVWTDDPQWAEKAVEALTERERWALKQALAGPHARYYGDGGTIHSSRLLDVEVTQHGEVVSVWFRCQMLPFRVSVVGDRRAEHMKAAAGLPAVTGVEVAE